MCIRDRFHTIYWPIFLLAAGIELPKQVIVHAHWLSDGFKMSKSLGNVVDPFDILEYYGEDAVRFFLMENSNIQDDCKYREELLHQTREAIIGKYANLMSRCGNSKFDIRQSVEDWRNGRFSDVDTLINEQALNKDQTQSIIEARRHQPSILFIPNIDIWFQVVPQSAKATLTSLLRNLKSDEKVLLLGIAESPVDELDPEVQVLFGLDNHANNVKLQNPSREQRQHYFSTLFKTIRMKPYEFINDLENRPCLLYTSRKTQPI